MLRDYQKDIYFKVISMLKQGYHAPLVCLPCRSGKSYIMLEMIANMKGNALVLAHRKELIKQHKELLSDLHNVRIESVFTEANHLNIDNRPSVIFIDEAHLSEANSYKKVCEFYNSIVIGFTATPIRLDGKRLSLYDCIVTGITANELMDMGAISKYDYYAPDLGLDFDDVTVARGDYVTSELEQIMSKPRIYNSVIEKYKELANGKQAIAYCTSVKHSIALYEEFNASGIKSMHIDGKTPKNERMKAMEDFKSGKYTVLCNVGLISEGITVPDCEVCLLVRPTQSLALYIQQAMRCLTPKPNKRAIIIDYVGNFQRHGTPTMDRVWTLNGVKRMKRINDDGSFAIRQCKRCYMVFQTASVCPYCGYTYEVKGRELERMQEVELKKINEEHLKEIENKKRSMRMEVGKCRTIDDLRRIQQERGYSPGWIWQMARIKGIHG